MRATTLLVLLVLAGASCTGKANPSDPRTCPPGLPTPGAACEVEELRCSYGPSCGATMKCVAGAWTKNDSGCVVDAGPCPTAAPRDGEPCAAGALTCTYACGDGGTLSATCTSASWRLVASGCALPK